MQNTNFETYTVQPIGSQSPTTLAKAAKHPLRLLVSNVGPVVIFVSLTTTDLFPTPTTASYRVFPGEQHSFVLAPRQGVYAVGAAVGGLLSVTASEALPLGGPQ
jgi:hypothetical protein